MRLQVPPPSTAENWAWHHRHQRIAKNINSRWSKCCQQSHNYYNSPGKWKNTDYLTKNCEPKWRGRLQRILWWVVLPRNFQRNSSNSICIAQYHNWKESMSIQLLPCLLAKSMIFVTLYNTRSYSILVTSLGELWTRRFKVFFERNKPKIINHQSPQVDYRWIASWMWQISSWYSCCPTTSSN